MKGKGSVLVAPLNWGLGHATRCIPIIKALQKQGFSPVIASDGAALSLLEKEFPELEFYELPSLQIKYSKRGFWFKFKIILQLFRLQQCIKREKHFINTLASQMNLKGIIADNRLGLNHPQIPSVIISHQLKVYSGSTTWLTTKLHQKFIAKYNECWVPDYPNRPYLSGRLGHLRRTKLHLKYIGVLSRFEIREEPLKYDVLVLLSGPEPQRSMLEKKILKEFKDYDGKVVLVRGLIDAKDNIDNHSNMLVYNYLTAKPLEALILQSEIIVARSGYTTLMDLSKLNKKAFFIPTPGQSEQQYLARRLKRYLIAPYCQQDKFKLDELKRVKRYKGLINLGKGSDDMFFDGLFDLFDGK